MFGKLYTFYSIKWIYLSALFIFEVGSLICAVTPTSVGLICGRAIAGLGAAGLFSGSILIISKTVPLVKRPMYTGLIGAMFGIANVAGPLYVGPIPWLLNDANLPQHGRRIYRPPHLALVFLHQLASWRSDVLLRIVLLPSAESHLEEEHLEGSNQGAGPDWFCLFPTLYHQLVARPAMGWHQVCVGQWTHHWPIGGLWRPRPRLHWCTDLGRRPGNRPAAPYQEP